MILVLLIHVQMVMNANRRDLLLELVTRQLETHRHQRGVRDRMRVERGSVAWRESVNRSRVGCVIAGVARVGRGSIWLVDQHRQVKAIFVQDLDTLVERHSQRIILAAIYSHRLVVEGMSVCKTVVVVLVNKPDLALIQLMSIPTRCSLQLDQKAQYCIRVQVLTTNGYIVVGNNIIVQNQTLMVYKPVVVTTYVDRVDVCQSIVRRQCVV